MKHILHVYLLTSTIGLFMVTGYIMGQALQYVNLTINRIQSAEVEIELLRKEVKVLNQSIAH